MDMENLFYINVEMNQRLIARENPEYMGSSQKIQSLGQDFFVPHLIVWASLNALSIVGFYTLSADELHHYYFSF